MSELGDLLELLHDSRSRWRTVRLTLRSWTDNVRVEQARVRALGRAGTGYGPSLPAESNVHTLLWFEQPDRLRREVAADDGLSVEVRRAGRWWSWHSEGGAWSNEDDDETEPGASGELDPLLDPAQLLGGLAFELLGRTSAAGRRAIRVRGVSRGPGQRWSRVAVGADEHELLVDAERGVLLAIVSRLDGEDIAIEEVEEIAFDEDLPPATFVFDPPAGTVVRPAGGARLRELTLDEAVARATFPLWKVDPPEPDWTLTVLDAGGDGDESLGVNLHYASGDGSIHVQVVQQPADEDRGWVGYGERTEIEREGELLTLWEPPDDQGLAQVALVRGQTAITLQSLDLGAWQLVELALALVPAG